jgi:poly-gamma-glutamate capsule biosynthesis protein CapA/YwtB (metallophosphatase superfamily)
VQNIIIFLHLTVALIVPEIMKKRKILPVIGLTLLGITVLIGCQPKRVSSEEPDFSLVPKAQATPVKSENTEPITIAAVGDIMLGSTSIDETFLPPEDGRDMLKEFTPILSSADIAFGNLEGPMLEGGKNEKCPPESTRCFAFRMPTRYGKHLKEAGFDVLSLANNHTGDFGDEGRLSTRKVLDEAGIKHAGSDRARYSTTYLETKGKKIAFVGFAHNNIVPNVNDLTAARQFVAQAGKNADIVVVSFHGGAEGEKAQNVQWQTETLGTEKRGNLPLFARTVIDAGADLILGHGPHVLRGMEIYKDRLIVYSMGNFATYGMFNLKGAQGLNAVFEMQIAADGKFLNGKIHPGRQEGRGIPVPDKTSAAIRKIRFLSQTDFPATAPKIADDGTITAKENAKIESQKKAKSQKRKRF